MSQTWQVHCGDALSVLKTLPDRSVDCVVTSPPYFGLRDYQTGTWTGGDRECAHAPRAQLRGTTNGDPSAGTLRDKPSRVCKCGAERVDQQIGLEDSPQAYVSALVAIFAECKRVLKDEGTLWLNLGDSYSGSWGNQGRKDERGTQRPINGGMLTKVHDGRYPSQTSNTGKLHAGIKQKDLIGIPWSVAFALRADGWYLRSEIIWHKKSCMPESVKDRPTKSHEQVFLLAKQARYFYDQDAIRESYAESTIAMGSGAVTGRGLGKEACKQPNGNAQMSNSGGFPRQYGPSVVNDGQLLIADDLERFSQPEVYNGEGQKDYASAGVQNPSAVKKRILKGARPPGNGRWSDVEALRKAHGVKKITGNQANSCMGIPANVANARSVWSLGPEPATDINHFAVMPKTLARRCILAGCPFGGTVLDPFAGSGTTGIVALEEGRSFIGIELNPEHHALARQRLGNTAPLLACEAGA